MSYEPTNWKTGDVVTSAKLNKLENGVANAGGGGNLILHETVTEDGNFTIHTLDKTWKEISDVFMAGGAVYIIDSNIKAEETIYVRRTVTSIVTYVEDGETGYGIVFEPKAGDNSSEYSTDIENGYPSQYFSK